MARRARGRRGLVLGARRRRGLQRPGAALSLAALSEPQRPPRAGTASGQGEQQLWSRAGAGRQGLWAIGLPTFELTVSGILRRTSSQLGSVRRLRIRMRLSACVCVGAFPGVLDGTSRLGSSTCGLRPPGADDRRSRWHIRNLGARGLAETQ